MLGIQEMTVFSYLRSASSWFSADYATDQPGRCIICKFQEEAIAFSCLLLATPMMLMCMKITYVNNWLTSVGFYV